MEFTVRIEKRHLAMVGVVGVAALSGYVVGARADGIPTTQPLFYSGTIENGDTLVDDQSLPIGLKLFTDATPGAPDTELCDVPAINRVVERGQFRIDASACLAAVADNADVFAEVTVDTATLPRVKIGAVPFAVTARAADTAGTAAAVDDGAVTTASLEGHARVLAAEVRGSDGGLIQSNTPWVAAAVQTAVGTYRVSAVADERLSTCVCTAKNNLASCSYSRVDARTFAITTANLEGGAGFNSDFHLMCLSY